ncbi:MFS transporter [Enterobacter pasteurii]
MLKVITTALYVLLFIPVWAWRKFLGHSRFERLFHNRSSAWDHPLTLTKEHSGRVTRSIFLKIWTAIFLASLSTFFLLMVLAARVFNDSASPLAANMVVLTQWLPAVLALPLIRRAGARFSPRNLLRTSEFASALIVPAIAFVSGSYYVMIFLLLLKGGLDSLSKMARAVALKNYFSGQALNQAASYYNTAMLGGAGVGALLGALLLSVLPLEAILGLCMICHLAAGILYTRLPAPLNDVKIPTANGTSFHTPVRDPRLHMSIIYYVSTVALYQGYQNVARSVYPTEQLGMDPSGIALIQTIASFAYILGAIFAARLDLSGNRYTVTAPVSHLLTLALMLPLPFITSAVPGLAVYGLFALLFEVAWAVHQRYIIVAAPPEQLGKIVANANALGLGAMIVVALLGSILVEQLNFGSVTLSFIVLALMIPVLINVFLGKKRVSSAVGEGE